jgi:hypothetical protein
MAVFCSSLTSWFPGIVFTYFLNDFEMVPVAALFFFSDSAAQRGFLVHEVS